MAHSAELWPQMDFELDEITLFTPQKEKVLIGRPIIDWVAHLVAKLARRKHMPGGCILQRPCFGPTNPAGDRALFPVHWFFPWMRANSDRANSLLWKLTHEMLIGSSVALLGK